MMRSTSKLNWLSRIGLVVAGAFALVAGTLVSGVPALAAGTLTCYNPGYQTGVVGIYAAIGVVVDGGTTPYTYSANGLPPGKVIDSATGVISGIPALADDFRGVTVTVTDSSVPQQSCSTTFEWKIWPSKDPRPVPDLTENTVTQAQTALAAVGLVLGTVTYYLDCDFIGLVTGQNPLAGTNVAPGTAVNVWVGRYSRACLCLTTPTSGGGSTAGVGAAGLSATLPKTDMLPVC